MGMSEYLEPSCYEETIWCVTDANDDHRPRYICCIGKANLAQLLKLANTFGQPPCSCHLFAAALVLNSCRYRGRCCG